MTNFLISAFSDECGEASITGQIAACKVNRITHMELRGFGKGKNINATTVDEARVMKAALDDAGMHVSAIGSAYGKINIKEDFAPHFEAFKNTLAVAKVLGTRYIRMFSFYFDAEDSYEAYRDEVLHRVQMMADAAHDAGLLCCHENEKGIYGDNAERCLDLLTNVRHLRGVFDPANFVQCGVDTLHAFELLAPHIEYMHIKDALFADGRVVPAGKGDGNVKAILTAMAARGGDCILTLEPHLQSFEGLENLESHSETKRAMPQDVYPSKAASFKAAADALHDLLGEIAQEA
ncbi:MAG: sugar phosphate isomerase/epimerase [Clostridia bacterium]|nr:sugar phosphate isomerase/epimerase [Clostridia bacterium]